MAQRRTLSAVTEPEASHQLTIEQLAFESGLSVRNIRSHQARGLLPPPEVRRRVGYYGREHVERLRVIGELQAEGLNLKAIKQLLDDTQGTAERLLSLKRSVTAPLSLEQSEVLTEAELAERLGEDEDAYSRVLEKLVRLGVVTPIGADHYEVASPALITAAGETLARGISTTHVLELLDSLHNHSRSVARRVVRSFVDDAWKPFVQAGMPEERWPVVAESIERLRPLASAALAAVFAQSMSEEVESALGHATRRLSERKR